MKRHGIIVLEEGAVGTALVTIPTTLFPFSFRKNILRIVPTVLLQVILLADVTLLRSAFPSFPVVLFPLVVCVLITCRNRDFLLSLSVSVSLLIWIPWSLWILSNTD